MIPAIEIFVPADLADVSERLSFHSRPVFRREFPVKDGRLRTLVGICTPYESTKHVHNIATYIAKGGRRDKRIWGPSTFQPEMRGIDFELRSTADTRGTWLVGYCWQEVLTPSFLGILERVATDWPSVHRQVRDYRMELARAGHQIETDRDEELSPIGDRAEIEPPSQSTVRGAEETGVEPHSMDGSEKAARRNIARHNRRVDIWMYVNEHGLRLETGRYIYQHLPADKKGKKPCCYETLLDIVQRGKQGELAYHLDDKGR